MQKTQLMNNMRKCLKERKNKKITTKAEDLAPLFLLLNLAKLYLSSHLFIY